DGYLLSRSKDARVSLGCSPTFLKHKVKAAVMIQFLNPAWLWALLGMLVPIAIHLLSRKEGKVIPMGSTRFLSETSTSKFRSIKLNEVALLLLRCLLIALLVFFLAGVTIRSSQREKWILIEPGLE